MACRRQRRGSVQSQLPFAAARSVLLNSQNDTSNYDGWPDAVSTYPVRKPEVGRPDLRESLPLTRRGDQPDGPARRAIRWPLGDFARPIVQHASMGNMLQMRRSAFERDGLTLSYLDSGSGRPLVALHAHWMDGSTFVPLAAALSPNWRVIALDQRGHGFSDHAASYSRHDYLQDLLGLLGELRLPSAVLLGNSLGGVNAYQFAARHPDLVDALIIEDIGAKINDDTRFALPWAGLYPTRAALEERIGPRFANALSSSIRETARGWRLAFDPNDTVTSQDGLNGDHWDDWLASRCPTLLIRGRDSRVTDPTQLEQMAARRANTKGMTLDGGHVVHGDNPHGFAATVKEFLNELSPPASCRIDPL